MSQQCGTFQELVRIDRIENLLVHMFDYTIFVYFCLYPLYSRKDFPMSSKTRFLPLVILLGIFVTPMSAYAADASGNIQLVAPTQIQYRVKGDGTLISPTPAVLSFSNSSDFEVRIASVRFNAAEGFNIVEDAADSSLPNSISIKLGTAGEQLDMSDYTNARKKVGKDLAWTMTSSDVSETAATLPISTEGYGTNIRDVGTVGSVEWYVVSDTVTNQVLGDIDDLKTWQASVDEWQDEVNEKLAECPLPVGSVLQMTNGEDPNTLYPGTTWTKIEGKFLLGSSSTYSLGTTGGEATHTLSVAELPSHSHSYDKPKSNTNSTTLTAAQSGLPAHTHAFIQPTVNGGSHRHAIVKQVDNNSGSAINIGSGSAKVFYQNNNSVYTEYDGGHTHSVSGGAVGAVSGGAKDASSGHTHGISFDGVNTGTKGSGTAHNNMPPYEVVHVWKRTA